MIISCLYHLTYKCETEKNKKLLDVREFDGLIRNNDATEKKLPGVIIIGVKKCGTGALAEILKMHPQLAVPEYHKTEVQFWGYDDLYRLGLEYYKV